MKLHVICAVALTFLSHQPALSAQTDINQLWFTDAAKSIDATSVEQGLPSSGHSIRINAQLLDQLLLEQQSKIEVPIPMPNGTIRTFRMTPVQVMADELAKKYPQIRAYSGVDINASSNRGRFDLSPRGLTGMFMFDGQWVMLSNDPLNDKHRYISYFAKDESTSPEQLSYRNDTLEIPPSVLGQWQSSQTEASSLVAARPNGDEITAYRIAISAAAEYTRANGGADGALAELSRLINRVNQIFLTDLSIRFELVADNDKLIFSDGDTDPFVNDANEDLEANQQTIDDIIGSANYDIGHVVNTDSGGLATLQSVCVDNFKARGQSGSSRPFGDSFYIELVIHEFGHQLAAGHTFNAVSSGSCNEDQRSRLSAVEPGSGSTIMSYAGLCAKQNLQSDADPYFHSFSIEQIRNLLDARSCGIKQSNGNQIPVIATPVIEHVIPANTPFVLSAQVSDPDGDPLSFTWDQINPGNFDGATANVDELQSDNGANPLFRSNAPTSSAVRYFPRLNDVLNDTTSFAETYPTTDRQLDFELLARDGKGGVNTLLAQLEVVTTDGAFSVSSPQPQVRWIGGQSQTVVWNVAQTDTAPINCARVDVMLDADGDHEFESTLAASTINDGSEEVVAPSTNASNARIMVRCSDNVFFAVNPGDFTILPGEDPVAPLITGQLLRQITEDTSFDIELSQLIVDDPDSDYPSNFSLSILPGANYNSNGNTVVPELDFSGTLMVNVTVNDGNADSNIFVYQVDVEAVNDAPIANNDSVSIVQGSGSNTFSVLTNDRDPDMDVFVLTDITYLGSGSAEIQDGQIVYAPANSFFGTETITYRIEDPSGLSASATLSIEVRPIDNSPPPADSPDSGGGSVGWLFSLLLLGLARIVHWPKSWRQPCE